MTSNTVGNIAGATGDGPTPAASAASSAVGPCGACKFLRRKCISGCIFAPYFDSEQGAAHFAAVHKVFGASNVSKLLLHIPSHKRLDAVLTICYEAQSRLRDPVYGCVSHIFALQQQVINLQAELSYLHAHLATLELPSPPPLASTIDVPLSSSVDLSTLFDPHEHRQPELMRAIEDGCESGGGELQALARELMDRHRLSTTTDSRPPMAK